MIKSLFSFFDKKDKLKLIVLFFFIMLLGVVEIVSISLIMPFMALIANPSLVETNFYFNYLYQFLGLDSVNQFIFLLGMVVLSVLLISNIYASIVNWISIRFSYGQGHLIARKLLAGYLAQPYIFFLDHHSSTLVRNTTSEVFQLITTVLGPFLNLVKAVFVISCILLLLFFIDPMLALIICAMLGGLYALLSLGVRKHLTRLGAISLGLRDRTTKSLNEAFEGIKDIKILGKEKSLIAEFEKASVKLAAYQSRNVSLATLPRYLLEVIAFGGILLIILYLLKVKNDITQVLPLISLYAFAGYRLMPLLQNVINNLANIRFNMPMVQDLRNEIRYCQENQPSLTCVPQEALDFKEKIEFREISFAYPKGIKNIINQLSLTITKNTTVGFIGKTGSGKTTTIDLLLGLLTPQQGGIYIDDVLLTEANKRAWQDYMGYVSQHIYLHDTTIAQNIALGIKEEEIDLDRVKSAAQLAHIDEFIVNELAEGYQTRVGEQGVRLSGGQRQRIAIARALYHEPQVLIFDEATSALDNTTEQAVMEALSRLNHKKTIILIAHRLSTLSNCDEIFVLEDGRIINQGTYDEVLKRPKIS